MTTSGECPRCGAPVGDTDFACRNCGASFALGFGALDILGWVIFMFGRAGRLH